MRRGRRIRLTPTSSALLPTSWGPFRVRAYAEERTGRTHLALLRGELSGAERVLTRVHSACLSGDALFSLRCDCGRQLAAAMRRIAAARRGVLLYLDQEGRGIGLFDKIRAYSLQDLGLDTVEANQRLGHEPDPRDYSAATRILFDLGLSSIRLLTNNPRKLAALESGDVKVIERVPLLTRPTRRNGYYLQTKRNRLGHLL